MKKRLLTLLLAVCMLLSLLPVTANAAQVVDSGKFGENNSFSWTLDSDGTLTISGSGMIPNFMASEGLAHITTPWEKYLAQNKVTSIVIGEGITSIGTDCFFVNGWNRDIWNPTAVSGRETWNTSVTSVTLPDSVSELRPYSFAFLAGLKTVRVGKYLQVIRERAFMGCESLEQIDLENSMNLNGIEEYSFWNCKSLRSLTFPSGFYVDVPYRAGVIRKNAFTGCEKLDSLYFLGDIPAIYKGAFQGISPNLTLYFHKDREGWTAPYWTSHDLLGAEGETFRTAMLGHTTEVRNASAPTCKYLGYTGDKVCTVCDKVLEEGTWIPVVDHSWDTGKVTEPSSYFYTNGKRMFGCKSCGERKYVKEPLKPIPFVDVKDGDYFCDPIRWALDEDITKGTDATHFSPSASCTRAQVVTFMWRFSGSPEPQSSVCPFTDVPQTQYYYKAVLWAVESGIVTGTSATTFSPSAAVTREQFVTLLWRDFGSDMPASASSPFRDVTDPSYYSYNAILWAAEKGITMGVSSDRFAPTERCTRGQVMTFLFRDYYERFIKRI